VEGTLLPLWKFEYEKAKVKKPLKIQYNYMILCSRKGKVDAMLSVKFISYSEKITRAAVS
jgi:hypothetical protein